jgi:putative oxidoreductase
MWPRSGGRPVFAQPHALTDLALLLLRLMVAIVFVNSGSGMLRDPAAHAKDLGLPRSFTLFLGASEFLGGLAVALGILIQIAAAGLLVVNLGAVYKKIAVWRTGFWGDAGAGWSYDLLFVAMLFVIVTTGGGRYVVWG